MLLLLFFLLPSLLLLLCGSPFPSPVATRPPSPSFPSLVATRSPPKPFPSLVATHADPPSFPSLVAARAPSLQRLRVARPGEREKGRGDASLLDLEEGLSRARATIHRSTAAQNTSSSSSRRGEGEEDDDGDFVPARDVYHNPAAFYRYDLRLPGT